MNNTGYGYENSNILLGPAAAPPDGVILNFSNPYTLRPAMVALGVICAFITSILVGLRLTIKVFIIRRVLLEDYFCILGWLTFVSYVEVSLPIAWHGGGTHQWNVQLYHISKLSYVGYDITVMKS